MNRLSENLQKYIEELSKKDKKNLSQKTLKVMEEAGELAKVILPFENAFATNHRFIDRNKILEAIVDVYLTVISIAHDLEFSEDEVNEMIKTKTLKWARLQQQEMVLAEKIPYEIHVTVSDVDKDLFKEACRVLDVKPIILDLQNQDGETVFKDVMTSSVFFGNNRKAYEELKRISKGLEDKGIKVVREKIETVPWHPASPKNNGDQDMPDNCYFETHFAVVANKKNIEELKIIAKATGSHLSKNIFKKISETDFKIMMTYRAYSGVVEDFEVKVKQIEDYLKDFQVDKVITEFSLYDTKINHDSTWISK